MANVKISALPAVTTVDPAVDVLPLVSNAGASTTKATPEEIVYATLSVTGSSGDVFISQGTGVDPVWQSPLSIPVALTNVTAGEISDSANVINTVGKVAGRIIWDTTNTKIKVSVGSTATSNWVDADGTNPVTPAP